MVYSFIYLWKDYNEKGERGEKRRDESRMTDEQQLNKGIYMCTRKREIENNKRRRIVIERGTTPSDDCMTDQSIAIFIYENEKQIRKHISEKI